MTKFFVMRECDNILSGYLSAVTTVFSQQDEIYGFKFLTRYFGDLFQRSHSFVSFDSFLHLTNLLSKDLITNPTFGNYALSTAFAWLKNALRAVRHSHNYFIFIIIGTVIQVGSQNNVSLLN